MAFDDEFEAFKAFTASKGFTLQPVQPATSVQPTQQTAATRASTPPAVSASPATSAPPTASAPPPLSSAALARRATSKQPTLVRRAVSTQLPASSQPSAPTQPLAPVPPAVPTRRAASVQLAAPQQVAQPAMPAQPTTPIQPVVPARSTAPIQPAVPVRSAAPAQSNGNTAAGGRSSLVARRNTSSSVRQRQTPMSSAPAPSLVSAPRLVLSETTTTDNAAFMNELTQIRAGGGTIRIAFIGPEPHTKGVRKTALNIKRLLQMDSEGWTTVRVSLSPKTIYDLLNDIITAACQNLPSEDVGDQHDLIFQATGVPGNYTKGVQAGPPGPPRV
ncbi:hypothetical protein FRC08_009028 [Ceratobasidium sp. 394]|nr:hypothetical protein FRC08_009028 [Ceratobasidium sp. 394]